MCERDSHADAVEMFLNKCYEAINCASKWPPQAPIPWRFIPLPQKKRKRLRILPYSHTVKIDGCGASYDAALEWPDYKEWYLNFPQICRRFFPCTVLFDIRNARKKGFK